MPQTDFVRLAVSGETVDGRVINPDWLTEAAESYNPDVYTARINAEHISGLRPDGDYPAYGDVIELKAEEITLKIAGKDEKRTALYGKLDANDKLVALNKENQKVFTSIELHTDFMGRGSAYMSGLAMTDTPASIGTEKLKFSKNGEDNPVMISKAEETEIKFDQASEASDDIKGLTAVISTGLEKMTNLISGKSNDEPEQAPEEIAAAKAAEEAVKGDDAKFAAIGEGMKTMGDSITKLADAVTKRADATDQTIEELKKSIEETPAQNNFNRAKATGNSNGSLIL